MSQPPPPHYAQATRTVLRYAIVMTVIALLSGVAFQESSKKLPDAAVLAGLGLDSSLNLALVHGHVMVAAVLVPIAMLGAAFLSRAAGGSEIKPLALKTLTRGYLPLVTITIALMLYKGYHVLLSVRGGEHDLLAIEASYFGGVTAARHAVYGVAHTGMFVALAFFLFGLWKSLRPAGQTA
jgi:hypothetical protein